MMTIYNNQNMRERNKYDISLPLRVALMEKQMSISQFSKKSGINRTLLQNYLVNRNHASLSTIEKIAKNLSLM